MRGVSSDAPWRGHGDVIRSRVTGVGKGDRQRPSSVDEQTRTENYCRIFGHQYRNGHCRNCHQPEPKDT